MGGRKAMLTLMMSLLVGACGHAQQRQAPRRNAPIVRHVPAERGVLLQAVRIAAEDRGLEIAFIDPASGRITALSPVEQGGGMVTRERWRYRVQDGSVSVQLFLETRGADGWRTSPYLCPSYDYGQERQQLAAIAGVLGIRSAALGE